MFTLDALRGELGALTFARVTKMVYNEKHVTGGEGEGRTFSHFCGFTRTLDNAKKSVWFKKFNHVAHMHVGPVIHKTSLTRFEEYPRIGDILVGIVRASPKGDVFTWWVHQARPILELATMLQQESHFSRALRQSARTYGRLGHSDDLYLFARLVMGDAEPLVGQLLSEEKRPRHPVAKDASGYQRKRGFNLDRDPIAFAFFTAYMCRNVNIFKHVLAKINDGETGKYTLQRLHNMIDTAVPF